MAAQRILLFLAIAAIPASAQPCVWSPAALPNGVPGAVRAMAVFDDGTGPALYLGGVFSSAGGVPAQNLARYDGFNFLGVGGGLPLGSVEALQVFDDGGGPALYVGGTFLNAGGAAIAYVAKWDGVAFSALGTGLDGNVLSMTTYDDGGGTGLVVGGAFGMAGGAPAANIAMWRAGAWHPVGGGLPNYPTALAVFDDGSGDALYAGGSLFGSFAAVGRYQGAGWAPVGAFLPSFGGGVRALAVHDSGTGPALYAAGSLRVAGSALVSDGIARLSSGTWTSVGSGLGGFVGALASIDLGSGPQLFAGSTGLSVPGLPSPQHVVAWNGANWTQPMGLFGGSSPLVNAFCAFDPGTGTRLYVGGIFTSIGAVPALDLASFDGTAVFGSATGPTTPVMALAPADLGLGPSLYAVTGQVLLRRSGGSWDPSGRTFAPPSPGPGLGTPRALATFDDGTGTRLIVGGSFSGAGGVGSSSVIAYDGTSFLPLGPGVSGATPSPLNPTIPQVAAIAGFETPVGPVLAVGGHFTSSGATPVANVALWTQGAWFGAGAGLTYAVDPSLSLVQALAAYDDGTGLAVYAGGRFTVSGTAPIPYLAKWNGIAWSAPLGGTNGAVTDLAVFDDGTGPALYVAGSFSFAGSVPASGFARYRSGAFSAPAATGPGFPIQRLFVFDDGGGARLFALGNTGSSQGRIARLDGSVWTPIGPLLTGIVWSAAVLDEGLGPRMFLGGGLGVGTPGGPPVLEWSCPGAIGVSLSQPQGAGFPVYLQNANLTPGRTWFQVFSFDLCPVPGAGPYLGLCISDPTPILAQLTTPLGTAPFHVRPFTSSPLYGPYLVPPLTADVLCLDGTGGAIGASSPVVRIVIQ